MDKFAQMHVTTKIALAGIFGGALAFTCLAFSHSSYALQSPHAREGEYSSVSTTQSADMTQMVHDAFSAVYPWTVPSGAREIILPHHLVAAREIASLLRATPRPSIVYLVSPDHFSQGKTVFTTSDIGFANDFASSTLLRVDAQPFVREHGVYNLTPFIDAAWPGVQVVPVIVRIDAKQGARDALSDDLIRRLKDDSHALLITTVDFSHYQTAEVADFHDVLAEDVLRGLADREADRVEIDSPGALAVGLRVARTLGLGDVTIHAHTNSLRLLKAVIATESTSHFLVSFAPGPIASQERTTMLFTGDMMFDRTVATRWRKAKTPEYPFAHIRGQEDRFFKGQDLVIGNLEGPVTPVRRPPVKSIDFAFDPIIPKTLKSLGFDAVSQANNHSLDQGRQGAIDSKRYLADAGIVAFGDQVNDDATSSLRYIERRGKKIALLGFNTSDNPLDTAAALAGVREARAHANYVVVFMHWGNEYHEKPSQQQTDLAHLFIDNGVDVVIGAHPHWMESVEIYKNHLIAYSLGNFIFDQDWSVETTYGLTVGLAFTEKGSELHLFPVKIKESQPQLLTGAERAARLDRLAKISDPALSSMIHDGVVYSNQ